MSSIHRVAAYIKPESRAVTQVQYTQPIQYRMMMVCHTMGRPQLAP